MSKLSVGRCVQGRDNIQSDKQEMKTQHWAGTACGHITGRASSGGAPLPRFWIFLSVSLS